MYWHLHYVSGLSEILICLPHFSISMLPSVKKKTVTKFFHHCLGRRKDFQINNKDELQDFCVDYVEFVF